MRTTRIVDIYANQVPVNTAVRVAGWVRTRRDSKAGLSFVQLSDGSCHDTLQLVIANQLSNYTTDVLELSSGCSVVAEGTLVSSAGKGQSLELAVERLEVLGWVEDKDHYPIQPKRHSFEFLREQAHLRVRTNTFAAMARLRDSLSAQIHRFFRDNGFL
ncbi:MAG TPA: OB-fold nucleic acid binding domain-containing protein, partial [Polyangiaceae bacterium]